MGAVFQIRDDYLGVWGDEDRLGKPIASDIRRKKMCLPVVHALQSAQGDDRKSMQAIYGNDDPAGEEEVDMVLRGAGEDRGTGVLPGAGGRAQ